MRKKLKREEEKEGIRGEGGGHRRFRQFNGFGGGEPVREVEGEPMIDTGYANEESIGENDELIVKNDGKMMASCKRSKEMLIDRLSALPESLIIHILNFLSLKEAGITSVLSKRWRYLWADLPCLRFEQGEFQSGREFVNWVHRTLALRSLNYVEKFEVFFDYYKCYASDVTSWIEFALKFKVKELVILLQTDTVFYTLPQVIYSASSLTFLSMQRCVVAPRREPEWKSLIELSIDGVELDEDVIAKILAGCPVLHHLRITCCRGYSRLEITSPSLYSLLIADCEDEDTGPVLEISAPYIQSLDISVFPIGRKKLCLTNIASLVRAYIDFELVDGSTTAEALFNTMNIFENIQHVKELSLGRFCTEVMWELLETGWSLPQSELGSLTIDTSRCENHISGILRLLESSPDLDTLDIYCSGPYEESVKTWGPIERADLSCDLLHLKSVNLRNCADPNIGGEPMLTLARILLKRAISLEKMVIRVEKFTRFSSSCVFIKMTETVLNYPRSSHKVVVVFS